jgi:hypothetical protein
MAELKTRDTFDRLAADDVVERTAVALTNNGFCAAIIEDGKAARSEALELIPPDAVVMDMSSTTLKQLQLDKDINNTGNYASVRKKLMSMDAMKEGIEMKKAGAAPEWAVGSVHAITQDGHVMIASATGSQLPAYVYGAQHVLWIAGTQKIVKDISEGFRRIEEYVLPLEDKRSLEVYGAHSSINKLLILNKETVEDRIIILLVKEKLGF